MAVIELVGAGWTSSMGSALFPVPQCGVPAGWESGGNHIDGHNARQDLAEQRRKFEPVALRWG